jgi:N6-L-threonylcarbamoyladenine synthase
MIAWAGIERLWLGKIDPARAIGRPRWPLDEAAAAPGAKA